MAISLPQYHRVVAGEMILETVNSDSLSQNAILGVMKRLKAKDTIRISYEYTLDDGTTILSCRINLSHLSYLFMRLLRINMTHILMN